MDYSISRHSSGPGAFSYDWLPTPGMSNRARRGTWPAPLLAGQLYEAQPAWPFQFSLLALPAGLLLAGLVIPRAGVAREAVDLAR